MSDPEQARKDAIYDKHALAIGRANMVWNDVQSEVFQVFRCLSGMDWYSADAVFFAIRTDSAQRDMTAALARHVLYRRPSDLEEALKLLNSAGKLAAERNAAVHTAWHVREGAEAPTVYGRLNAPKALKPDALAQFTELDFRLKALFVQFNLFRRRVFTPDAERSSLGILLPPPAAPAPNLAEADPPPPSTEAPPLPPQSSQE